VWRGDCGRGKRRITEEREGGREGMKNKEEGDQDK